MPMKKLIFLLFILTTQALATPIAVEYWQDHKAVLKYKDDLEEKGLMLEVYHKNKMLYQIPGLGHGLFKLRKGDTRKILFFEDIDQDGKPEIVFKTLVNPAIIIKGFTLDPKGDHLLDMKKDLVTKFK